MAVPAEPRIYSSNSAGSDRALARTESHSYIGHFGAVEPSITLGRNCLLSGWMVAREIPIGTGGDAEETVEFRHTLIADHSQLPPVYSTPAMIRLMEIAAFQALQPYCEGDEITVGTAINIEHRAASGMGARIRAHAVLESFDGRFYTLRVTAHDDAREIGRGTVGRAVVSVGEFLQKMNSSPR
jgi:fluoroacetyl-CoA thioesterase